jgi:hypothetical protein
MPLGDLANRWALPNLKVIRSNVEQLVQDGRAATGPSFRHVGGRRICRSVSRADRQQQIEAAFGETKLVRSTSAPATWADSAVEKLSQLGFHAIAVHKSHLWVQGYHVQVGPYAGPKDIEDAQQPLASRGFKGRIAK